MTLEFVWEKPVAASAVPLRTGAEYLAELRRSNRCVFVNGERVSNVVDHPAFTGAAKSVASLFDYAAAPQNRERMTFVSPDTGGPVWRAFQIPQTHADLRAKRLAAEGWAEKSFGLMGRTPDHVANFFAGFAAVPEVFGSQGDRFVENVQNFYRHIRDNHKYVAYAIVPPQIDRSKPAHQQADPTLYAGVVSESETGIIIKGGQQLATGAVFADYLHLACIHPLRPGDENYAISVAIPMDAPGLKLYSRRAFPLQSTSMEDYPLTSRFDETDCFVVLDDVHVPWERVFIYKNVEASFNQWWKTPAHAYGNYQAQARYATKLRFLMGLAHRMNQATGNDKAPPVQVEMGELAAYASIVEQMLMSHEVSARHDENGVLWPSRQSLYSVMALQSKINAHMIDIVRELTGAAMISVPSSQRDFANPDARADIERYYVSSELNAHQRVKLMRLAWDFIGSEFGNRHQQYEKFYGGASFVVKGSMYRNYDFGRAGALVDAALAGIEG